MTVVTSTRIDSDALLGCTTPEGTLELFERLGYPVELLGAEYLLPETGGGVRRQE